MHHIRHKQPLSFLSLRINTFIETKLQMHIYLKPLLLHSSGFVRHVKYLPTNISESGSKFFLTFDWFYPTLWRGAVSECVNLTIYDPAIVTNIVRWSGNDTFGALSLFCFSPSTSIHSLSLLTLMHRLNCISTNIRWSLVSSWLEVFKTKALHYKSVPETRG